MTREKYLSIIAYTFILPINMSLDNREYVILSIDRSVVNREYAKYSTWPD